MSLFNWSSNYDMEKFLPPQLRTPIRMAWLKTLFKPIQTKFDNIFGTQSFYKGYNVINWSASTAYVKGNKIRYGNSVYECILPNVGIVPQGDKTDTWLLICTDFIGADQRAGFNNSKMLLEYILNLYLNTTFATIPTIYITKTPTDFNGFYDGYLIDNNQGEEGVAGNQIHFEGISYGLNTTSFTVFVPAALFTTLGTNAANRENRVRGIVDRYNTAGATYLVTTY